MKACSKGGGGNRGEGWTQGNMIMVHGWYGVGKTMGTTTMYENKLIFEKTLNALLSGLLQDICKCLN